MQEHKVGRPGFGPGPRSRLRRQPQRGVYDASTLYSVVDAAPICHVSMAVAGEPIALPMAFARLGSCLYLHGARANRLLGALSEGQPCCITFTLVDGLVFARTAFHHSMNFRSAVAFGQGRTVVDPVEKRRALDAIVDHLAAGRSAELPASTDREVQATLVVAVEIEEASVKVRTGPPAVEPEGDRPVWSGVVPLEVHAGSAERDPQLAAATGRSGAVDGLLRAYKGPAVWEQRSADRLLTTDFSRLDLAMIHSFLADESYWAKGVSRAAVEISLRNSLCVGAFVGEQQIGFGRLVSDGARFGYLADVFVVSEHRGQGHGGALLGFLLNLPQSRALQRITLGTEDAHRWYEGFGFVRGPEGRHMVRWAG